MDDLEFVIGAPVDIGEIPSPQQEKLSKYDALFRQVDQLAPGQWLPVTVASERMGQRLVEIAKLRGFIRKRRKLVVYLAKKDGGA